eukprot:5545387-Prymnesium_polylepis.1
MERSKSATQPCLASAHGISAGLHKFPAQRRSTRPAPPPRPPRPPRPRPLYAAPPVRSAGPQGRPIARRAGRLGKRRRPGQ